MTVRVRVCRDCCCGTPRKHPGIDHDDLLDALVEGTRGYAEVSVTECLLACDLSNVVVVSPGPVWFREVLDRATVSLLCGWVRSGGPDAPVPDALERHRALR